MRAALPLVLVVRERVERCKMEEGERERKRRRKRKRMVKLGSIHIEKG